MNEDDVLELWRSGINKNKLAEIYKRNYNKQIRIIRSSIRHRHDGRFITNKEALFIIERIIYKSIMKE